MKKIIIISAILGVCFSIIIYLNYKKNMNSKNDLYSLYFFQISAYKELKNASNGVEGLDNYLIIKEDDNLYHVYVGLTNNKENLSKIKEFYKENGNNIYVRERSVGCKKFINELEKYELLLSSAESKEVFYKIESEVLKKYKEYNCENIRYG